MKKYIYIVFLSMALACNTSTQKVDKKEVQVPGKKQVETTVLSSGNYGSLFENYECKLTIDEIAKVLHVSEENLKLSSFEGSKSCYIDLKIYGPETTRLSVGPVPGSKKSHKKMINEQLEYKEQNISIAGMSIELSETGDCYLRHQPMHGRILILNENYDQAIMLGFGNRNANNNRTEEQHEELKIKMTDLANYLLKKHRK